LDGIVSLVEKSVMQPVVGIRPEEPRYRMLETVREYGLEQLAASGEEGAVRAAHAAHVLALVETAEPGMEGPARTIWQDTLEAERANLRAVLTWATEHDLEMALRMGGALTLFWLARGHVGEARDVLDRVLAVEGGTPRARAKAMVTAAWMRYAQGDFVASSELAEAAVALARTAGERAVTAAALQAVGFAEAERLRVAASSDADGARFARAEGAFEEALVLVDEVGDRRSKGGILYGLGSLALDRDDTARAADHFAAALPIFEACGDRRQTGWTFAMMGRVAVRQGNDTGAAAWFARALGAFRDVGDRWSTTRMVQDVAWLAWRASRADDAVVLLGAAAALDEADGVSLGTAHHVDLGPSISALRASLGEETYVAAWTAGRTLSVDDATARSLALLEDIAGPADRQATAESSGWRG
jgi:tetratricopeptide (TPR) repeat protein